MSPPFKRPTFEPDDPTPTRLVFFLATLASSLFMAAVICAWCGLTSAAFVLAALIVVIGAVCLLAIAELP